MRAYRFLNSITEDPVGYWRHFDMELNPGFAYPTVSSAILLGANHGIHLAKVETGPKVLKGQYRLSMDRMRVTEFYKIQDIASLLALAARCLIPVLPLNLPEELRLYAAANECVIELKHPGHLARFIEDALEAAKTGSKAFYNTAFSIAQAVQGIYNYRTEQSPETILTNARTTLKHMSSEDIEQFDLVAPKFLSTPFEERISWL